MLTNLEKEVLALEVVFTAKGVRREDGMTAAQVEAEQRNQEDNTHGA